MTPTNKLRYVRRKVLIPETAWTAPTYVSELVLQQWFDPEYYVKGTGEPEEHGWRDVPIEEEK